MVTFSKLEWKKQKKQQNRCEGSDLNARTPMRIGPEPIAFDQAWQPSRLIKLRLSLYEFFVSKKDYGDFTFPSVRTTCSTCATAVPI